MIMIHSQSLNDLYEDLQEYILTFLPYQMIIHSVSLVCSRYYHLCQRTTLWKQIGLSQSVIHHCNLESTNFLGVIEQRRFTNLEIEGEEHADQVLIHSAPNVHVLRFTGMLLHYQAVGLTSFIRLQRLELNCYPVFLFSLLKGSHFPSLKELVVHLDINTRSRKWHYQLPSDVNIQSLTVFQLYSSKRLKPVGEFTTQVVTKNHCLRVLKLNRRVKLESISHCHLEELKLARERPEVVKDILFNNSNSLRKLSLKLVIPDLTILSCLTNLTVLSLTAQTALKSKEGLLPLIAQILPNLKCVTLGHDNILRKQWKYVYVPWTKLKVLGGFSWMDDMELSELLEHTPYLTDISLSTINLLGHSTNEYCELAEYINSTNNTTIQRIHCSFSDIASSDEVFYLLPATVKSVTIRITSIRRLSQILLLDISSYYVDSVDVFIDDAALIIKSELHELMDYERDEETDGEDLEANAQRFIGPFISTMKDHLITELSYRDRLGFDPRENTEMIAEYMNLFQSTSSFVANVRHFPVILRVFLNMIEHHQQEGTQTHS